MLYFWAMKTTAKALKPLKIAMAAGHVDEAARLLDSVDRDRFGEITRSLRPFVRRIEQLQDSAISRKSEVQESVQ